MKPKIVQRKMNGWLVQFPKSLKFYLDLDTASKAIATYYNKKRRLK